MRFLASAPCFALALAIAGCGARPLAQPESHIQSVPEPAPGTAQIPSTVRAVPMPPPPTARDAEIKYSVVVADQPVREVLLAIARETKINFDIHPGVEGTININAIDQSLKQILTRIAKQVDMRWEMDGQTITVLRDTPYLRSYRIDYVNMTRDVTETVGVATQIVSAGTAANTAGSGSANNSTLVISGTSKHHFWDTLEKNLKDLLRETDIKLPDGSSEKSTQGQAQRSIPRGGRTSTPLIGSSSTTPSSDLKDVISPPAIFAGQDEVKVSTLTFREAAFVIVNPETGVISIRATSRQHERVQEFLEQIAGSSKRQVLIEATIVEVTLNDNYQSGVDWSALGLNGLGYSIRQSFTGANLTNAPFFSIAYSNPNAAAGGSISSTVRLLDSFGRTRVLSSPKLMALNNQTAMLKVVDNNVYFSIKADTVTNNNTAVTTFTTTQNVIPVGFIMHVTPQISDGDMVTLNVRPTVTKIIDFVNDPNPSLATANVVSKIPVTQTREMESVLKVASGQTAILGGLMLDSFIGKRDGLPVASRIPIFGDLVSYRNDAAQKTELVIFIRPIVIRDASVDGDLSAYRRFLPDQQFFRDTRSPMPCFETGLQRMEDKALTGDFPCVTPVPVVPPPKGPT